MTSRCKVREIVSGLNKSATSYNFIGACSKNRRQLFSIIIGLLCIYIVLAANIAGVCGT